MSAVYSHTSAFHYAAYRPKLHRAILDRLLFGGTIFPVGLDIGCGTGQSAIALAQYCSSVYAIDSSPAMLELALPGEHVSYHQGSADDLPLRDTVVDITTLAGSQFYVKSDGLVMELLRVCRPQAVVVVYDFNIRTADLLACCGIPPIKSRSDYNHAVNFSDRTEFNELSAGEDEAEIKLSASEAAHLFLAQSRNHEAFAKKYDTADPFSDLARELRNKRDRYQLKTDIYFSMYRLKK